MSVQPYRPVELMRNEKLTKSNFDDFIGVWEGFVPKSICEEAISFFNKNFEELGCEIEPTSNSESPDVIHDVKFHASEDLYGGCLNRRDYALLINYSNQELTYKVNQFLKSCALHYISNFPQLKHAGLISTDIKMQKTPPGGGYHLWHYENSNMAHAMRDLTWMIYLNDMPEGDGETEFLYQRRRIRPTRGTVVIWPAGYTHVHKGNTVFSQDKYILTGWYIKNS
jgi:hypothetical protein